MPAGVTVRLTVGNETKSAHIGLPHDAGAERIGYPFTDVTHFRYWRRKPPIGVVCPPRGFRELPVSRGMCCTLQAVAGQEQFGCPLFRPTVPSRLK